MESIISKTIEMTVDGKVYLIKVVDFNEFEIVGQNDKGEYIHIPKMKAGVYKVVGDIPKDIFLYVCKNEISACKGKRFLTMKSDADIGVMCCPLAKECNCFFKNAGGLMRLPINVQLAILNDMASKNPFAEEIKKKGEK